MSPLVLSVPEYVILEHYLSTGNVKSAEAFEKITNKCPMIIEANEGESGSYGNYSTTEYVFSIGEETYLVMADNNSLGNATEFNWYCAAKVKPVTKTITVYERVE